MTSCLSLFKHGIWVIGLLASPLFALPTVESRTGDPVIPTGSDLQQGSSTARRSFEPTYSSAAPLSGEDRAAHLTLTQIEALQREVSELRGLLETQEHQIKQLRKSQQDCYVDLESRIKQLQGASHSPASKVSKPTVGVGNAAVGPANAAARAITNASKETKPTELSSPPAASVSAPLKPVASSAAAAAPPSAGEQEAYQAAYQLVRTKRYVEAISSLQQYLRRFPKTENAAAAHYWLGEVYLLQWQNDKTNDALLEKASHEFSAVTTQFPHHAKVVDATLKLGLIEFDKGNQVTAEHYLTEVKTRYPGTAAARLAATRLQQIASD